MVLLKAIPLLVARIHGHEILYASMMLPVFFIGYNWDDEGFPERRGFWFRRSWNSDVVRQGLIISWLVYSFNIHFICLKGESRIPPVYYLLLCTLLHFYEYSFIQPKQSKEEKKDRLFLKMLYLNSADFMPFVVVRRI